MMDKKEQLDWWFIFGWFLAALGHAFSWFSGLAFTVLGIFFLLSSVVILAF